MNQSFIRRLFFYGWKGLTLYFSEYFVDEYSTQISNTFSLCSFFTGSGLCCWMHFDKKIAFGFPCFTIDTSILYIYTIPQQPPPPLRTHHITLSHTHLPLWCAFSFCLFSHTVCAYYYDDKSRGMSVNASSEIGLIGAISAWDKLEMTTISFCFSFPIPLHKKSHVLAFLLMMNWSVLCPGGGRHHRGSPRRLVGRDKHLHVDYNVSGLLQAGQNYSGSTTLGLMEDLKWLKFK